MNSKVISVIAMKTALDCCIRAPLLLVLVLALLQPAEGYTCERPDYIMCRTGEHCIDRNKICDGMRDCTDGSDEDPRMCRLWPVKSEQCCQASDGNIIYYDGECQNARYMCEDHNRAKHIYFKVCQIVRHWPKLQFQDDRTCISSDVAAVLGSAVDASVTENQTDCPVLYKRVGEECLSFFSPSKVTWDEANEFCHRIRGELWQSNRVEEYAVLLEYMREEYITADYWIGGRFENVSAAWAWSIDNSTMPLGAPFWAVKYNDTCVPRGPPQIRPHFPPPPALQGAQCYREVLSPTNRSLGWCAAMTYQYFHYWSDEQCNEGFSPLCIYTGLPPPPTTTTTTTTSPNTTTTSPNTTTTSPNTTTTSPNTTTASSTTTNTTSTTIPSSPIPISTTYGN